MIPPDLMRQAREAFNKLCDTGAPYAGFEAALSGLSAAWPVADGRPREALAYYAKEYDHAVGCSVWDGGAIARAALSPPSAPAADVRIVRVAVARNLDNEWGACVIEEGQRDRDIFGELEFDGYAGCLCIAEIPVPIRDVPTVRDSVTEVPHD